METTKQRELEDLVKILQDKRQTAISAEGTWLVLKIAVNPKIKSLVENLIFKPIGWEDAWYKMDWGRIQGSVYYNVDEFCITGEKVCIKCQDKVVMGKNEYCLGCSIESRKEQNREAKRRQREREKQCQH